MKFRQLAAKNVLGNKHQYGAFFLSSVFSVMIFFIYAAVIFHPDVIHGEIQGGNGVRLIMIGCEYIIMIFSFFFVLYSCSAFLKSRQKEFGLLFLFGFTKGKLRRMVSYENMLICAASLAVGIGLGILFSKLFFMSLSSIMQVDNPIHFYVPGRAVVITVIGYVALFLVITLLSMRRVGNRQIIDLMQESKKPKTPPRSSWFLVLISVLCLGAGYGLAYTMSVNTLMMAILPIIFLVVTGTYFLFTQSSVAVFNGLKRNKPFFYRGTNLIVVSQMVHKVKDNARILFLVSVLCGVILTASATLNVFYSGSKEQLIEHMPQSIGFVEDSLTTNAVADPEEVRRIIRDHGLTLAYELRLVGVPVSVNLPKVGKKSVMAISEKDFNTQAARMDHIDPLQVDKGKAYFIYPYKEFVSEIVRPGDELQFAAGDRTEHIKMLDQRTAMIVKPVRSASYLIVMDDEQYAEMASQIPDEKKAAAYGFEINEWDSKAALEASDEIMQIVPKELISRFESRTHDYFKIKQFSALTMFIGIFISVLFFLASGSLLFFKMFTEFQEDQAQMVAISRMGLTPKEMKKIVTSQIGVLFYVPCVVGAIHLIFAMKALANVLFANVWIYAGLVLFLYVLLQTGYFLAARHTYLKRMKQLSLV
jgi:putative ABC transport system permease protein